MNMTKKFAIIRSITMVGVPLVAFTVVNSENNKSNKDIEKDVKNIESKTLTSK